MTATHIVLSAVCAVLAAGCGQLITPMPHVNSGITQATPTPIPTVTLRPSSTPAPATLAPTATPTVTATPIVYTVQPGDTLLVIAAQFGVSVQAIQDANGIMDPRRLQVGQSLMVPGPEDNPEQPPTPTPTPLPLSVQGLSFQRTPAGGLWALGEVRNPGTEGVSEVSVQVSLLDGLGQLLAAQSAYLQLDVVPPAGAVAFAVLFTEPPAEFAQYQATVLTGVPFSVNTRYYLDLAATEVQARTIGADTYRVSGQLVNRGTSDAERLQLLVTGYDDQHHVTAVRQSPLAVSILRAAAMTPFQLDLATVGSPVVTHSVQAQALTIQ
jgi:LysM repeat protein